MRTLAEGWEVQVHAEQALSGAALALALPASATPVDDQVRVRTVQRHGHEFLELGVDLPAGTSSWLLRP